MVSCLRHTMEAIVLSSCPMSTSVGDIHFQHGLVWYYKLLSTWHKSFLSVLSLLMEGKYFEILITLLTSFLDHIRWIQACRLSFPWKSKIPLEHFTNPFCFQTWCCIIAFSFDIEITCITLSMSQNASVILENDLQFGYDGISFKTHVHSFLRNIIRLIRIWSLLQKK